MTYPSLSDYSDEEFSPKVQAEISAYESSQNSSPVSFIDGGYEEISADIQKQIDEFYEASENSGPVFSFLSDTELDDSEDADEVLTRVVQKFDKIVDDASQGKTPVIDDEMQRLIPQPKKKDYFKIMGLGYQVTREDKRKKRAWWFAVIGWVIVDKHDYDYFTTHEGAPYVKETERIMNEYEEKLAAYNEALKKLPIENARHGCACQWTPPKPMDPRKPNPWKRY